MTGPDIGTIVIFGVVLAPVYLMLLGWFLGKPRDLRRSFMGVGVMASITVGMWAGLALFAELLGVLFF
jgi:hypothetical protein